MMFTMKVRRVLASLVVLCSAMAFSASADEKAGVTELKSPLLKASRIQVERVATSAEEAEKMFDKVDVKNLNVDFTKYKLVGFAWSGSGQDELTGDLKKSEDGEVHAVFTYKRGMTRDLRSHLKTFQVPKDAKIASPWQEDSK